jgi:hypothetical protein
LELSQAHIGLHNTIQAAHVVSAEALKALTSTSITSSVATAKDLMMMRWLDHCLILLSQQ